ncbi:MAG: glycosyltransferase, partial [Candidatus Binataceae bacterium]
LRQENRGLSAARNAGIAACKSEYIAFLDADDVWLPTKLAKTMRVLKRHPECGVVYSDLIEVDAAGTVINERYVPPEFAHPPTLADLLRTWWYILPSTVVMRRALFEACGGFREEFGRRGYGGEDTFLWLVAREHAEFQFVPEPLCFRQVSSPNEVRSKRHSSLSTHGATATNDPGECVAGYEVFVQLVHERYGKSAARLIRTVRRGQAEVLVNLGLLAMVDGDRKFARSCYLCAVRYAPSLTKTYARLLWTWLPRKFGTRLAAMMPARVERGLMGPPFGGYRADLERPRSGIL